MPYFIPTSSFDYADNRAKGLPSPSHQQKGTPEAAIEDSCSMPRHCQGCRNIPSHNDCLSSVLHDPASNAHIYDTLL